MGRLAKSLASLVLGMSLFCSFGVSAQDIAAEESQAIHAVVQTQLEAFAADDAETAFELASEGTQALLGSPQALLGIVREWYPPLYRPQKAEFSPAEIVEDHAIQEVAITDSNGVIWIAIFLMQLDEEANWKVDSYHLVETTSMET